MSNVTGHVCPLCGSPGVEVGVKEDVPLRECCGTLLAWSWPDEQAYYNWYSHSDSYHEVQQRREGQLPMVDRDPEYVVASSVRVRIIAGLYPTVRRVLDIGAGTGAFVAVASGHGLAALGLEPNHRLVARARAQGRNLEVGGWRESSGEWDLVAMHDVFEHITRPEECLKHLRSLLSPTGILVIEMPEWESPEARRQGFGWRHVRPLQHVCLYSDTAAQNLFRRNGLAVDALVRPLSGAIGKVTYFLRPT